jgi:threonine dehydrogenase-like Zn-dependent dehydrogenase
VALLLSGSIGTAAAQLAKHFGADVTAVCNSKNVSSWIARRRQGDDYTQEDFTKGAETDDLVFDAVGKLSFGAVGVLALAVRRQGARRREWILIGLAAALLLGGHPFQAGTLAFGCSFIGARLQTFSASLWRPSSA